MSNQHYFDVPFAFSGDVTAIPDPLQSGGTVSFTEGWNYNYQRNLSTDPAALPIDRSTMNWLLKQITTAIAALQAETIPEWITAAQNGGVALSYGAGSEVFWSASGNAPFTKFVSITAGNVLTPSVSDPLGATTGWQIAADPIATSAQATAGTNNGSIMTPLLVAQQTALRALLAGSATQVFNVGPATAATHAVEFGQLAIIGNSRGVFAYNAAVSASMTFTAAAIVTKTAINGLTQLLTGYSQTCTLTTVGAGGVDTGTVAVGVYLAVYAISGTAGTSILAQVFTTTVAPEQYGGTHMPAGYTYSQLIGIIGSGTSVNQFNAGAIIGRKYAGPRVSFTVSTANNSAQTIATTGLFPPNAVAITGDIFFSSSSNTDAYLATLAPAPNAIGQVAYRGGGPGASLQEPFSIPIITPQTFYYTNTGATGTISFQFAIAGWEF